MRLSTALLLATLLVPLLAAGWLAARRGTAAQPVRASAPPPALVATAPTAPATPVAPRREPLPPVVVVASQFFDWSKMEVIGDVTGFYREMTMPLHGHPGLYRFRWNTELVADVRTQTVHPPPDGVELGPLAIAQAGQQQVEVNGLTITVGDSLVGYSGDGRIIWQISQEGMGPTLTWPPGGMGLVSTGDDVVTYGYHDMSDTGVSLTRNRASDGEFLWHVYADPLQVSHSKYWHLAYVVIVDDTLILVSQGSAGNIVEKRDAHTGALLARKQF